MIVEELLKNISGLPDGTMTAFHDVIATNNRVVITHGSASSLRNVGEKLLKVDGTLPVYVRITASSPTERELHKIIYCRPEQFCVYTVG